MTSKKTPDDWDDWTVVAEESGIRMVFDKIGDQFTGTYVGREIVQITENGEDKDVTQLNFRDMDAQKFCTFPGFKLREAFEDIDPGTMVRITYMAEISVKNQVSPMKDFRVETR